MTTKTSYSDLVAKAEEAVALVNDPALKAIGFQTVLTALLHDAAPNNVRKANPDEKQATTTTKSKPANGPRNRSPKAGTQAYVDELVNDGYFAKPKTIADVKAELEVRGHHIPLTSLSGPLQALCQRKTLRRQKVKRPGKKTEAYGYSNW